MTTKIKIIAGFTIMVLLLAVVGWMGYSDIQATSKNFKEYQRLANFNVLLSDMEADTHEAVSSTYQFLNTLNADHLNDAKASIKTFEGRMKTAHELVLQLDRIAALDNLSNEMKQFEIMQSTIFNNITEMNKQYQDIVQIRMKTIADNLITLTDQANAVGSLEGLVSITRIWDSIATARSGLSRFSQSRAEADAELNRQYLAQVGEAFTDLKPLLRSQEGLRIFASLNDSFSELNNAFTLMEKLSAAVRDSQIAIAVLLSNMTQSISVLNGEVDTHMRSFGEGMLKANDLTQTKMLSISGIGLCLGILIALFIVWGIVRVLNAVAHFSTSVAQGDFADKINVREKGEIGRMIKAMQQIPVVLQNVISETQVLANDIMSGKLRARLDSKALPGSFGDIAVGINTVSDAYSSLLDALPLPVMACDKNFHITFLNTTGQTAVGGDFMGESCKSHLNSPSCASSDTCAGSCAMEQKKAVSMEVTINPQGKKMEVAVSCMPLYDMQGEVAGYCEILTDLTEMKNKQATMLQVATEASEISSRVAAASEQLSAQVEQISRGAEVQRSRIESTASAMEEMNATVLEVARSAGQASEQSEGTRQKANDGAHLVDRVVQSINQVNNVALALQDNMKELGTQAEGIGGVMNVISDIADQTNLLALNAAIEAARAGEAGRGFAVVADSVRQLAEKTMAATHEVNNNITAIQKSTQKNITEVGNAVKSVVEATTLADQSGIALKEIVQLASSNSAVVASIATAAEEQSATSEEINRSVEEINNVVGETTEGIIQSAAAVQELSHMAQQLRQVMEGLK